MSHKYTQTEALKHQAYSTLLFPLFLLFLALGTSLSWAQATMDEETPSPISVQSFADPQTATLGDTIEWKLIVVHDPDIQLSKLNVPEIEGFDNLGQKPPVTNKIGDQIEETFTIQLRADRIGDVPLPEIDIEFTAPSSDGALTAGVIKSQPANISVQSILRLQGEPKDIRDIKPILKAPPDWTRWILLTVLASLLLYASYLLWKKKGLRDNEKTGGQAPPLSAYERAIKELRELEKKGYLEIGEIRKFYFELSEIFRRYLGERCNIPALDWTTEEISQWTNGFKEWDEFRIQKLNSLLRRIDRIKFAKAQISPERNDSEAVLNFIEATHVKADLQEPVNFSPVSGISEKKPA